MMTGPVGLRCLGRSRLFRYEVRCWRDGTIPDRRLAPAPPSVFPLTLPGAQALIARVADVPRHTWGRDAFGTGDMWNSNSVISWLLLTSGVDAAELDPPDGGAAPGWAAGIIAAEHPPVAPARPQQPPQGPPLGTIPPGERCDQPTGPGCSARRTSSAMRSTTTGHTASGQLVADAVEDEQLRARDRRRRGPSAADADERVGGAVDDERRHVETTQSLRTVRGGQAGLQLAGESRGVVGAVEGPRRPRPHLVRPPSDRTVNPSPGSTAPLPRSPRPGCPPEAPSTGRSRRRWPPPPRDRRWST